MTKQQILPVAKITNASVPVIVGAGLSGLTAAHELKRNGIESIILEATARVGGRAWTVNLFADNFHEEQGATYICSDHHQMLTFARQFNIPLVTLTNQKILHLHRFVWEAKVYTPEELFKLFAPTLRRINDDAQLNDRVLQFSELSIEQYLDNIKAPLMLKKWVAIAVINEFGLQLNRLNALYLFKITTVDFANHYFSFFAGAGDEKYVVKDGVKRFAEALHHGLEKQSYFEHVVRKIAENSDGFLLEINTPLGLVRLQAPQVIVTAPLPVIKEVIDISLQGMSRQVWQTALAHMAPGFNQKIFYYFSQDLWGKELGGASTFGLEGELFIDSTFKQTASGIHCLMNFRGGTDSEPVSVASIEQNLKTLLEIMPQLKTHFLGYRVGLDWGRYEHARMSYSCSRQPLHSKKQPLPFNPASNLYFSGEMWSTTFQGYMEGAEQTGLKAAREIIQNRSRC